MSTATTPRGRSSQRRTRCKCAAGAGGDRAAACCFNPLRSLFRCPGRGRGRRSRSRSRHATPSRVRDAPVTGGAEQQSEEPSFFVYAMPNQGGGGVIADHSKKKKKKKKHSKPRLPSIRSCFRGKKNKERKANAAAVIARRQALTPAPSLVTHAPHSPSAPEKAQAVAPSATQPPSPAVTENGRTNSPATPRPGKQSTSSSSAPSPFPPQRQQPKQVEGLEIVEVATGERLSAHDVGLIEMVGSSADVSAESSRKSSLDYANEPPQQLTASSKRTAVDRKAAVVKATEPTRLWLNGNAGKRNAGERFTGPPVAGEADELWAHDIACSRVHAVMLAETVSYG